MRISDWISDVCSSDLLPGSVPVTGVSPVSASATLISQAASAFCEREFRAPTAMAVQGPASVLCLGCSVSDTDLAIDGDATTDATISIQIGRASCRERVCKYV